MFTNAGNTGGVAGGDSGSIVFNPLRVENPDTIP